jgi:hypothetical protein
MDKEKKKFKDTKLGKILKEKAPKVLDMVDDYFPPAKILTALVGNEPSITPQQKQELFTEIRNYELTELQEYLKDVQSARSREVEITKVTGKRDVTLMILAYFGVAAPVAILVYLLAYGMPEMDKEISLMIGTLIGMIVGEYKTIFGYFFGSSAGSKDKSEAIKKMMDE